MIGILKELTPIRDEFLNVNWFLSIEDAKMKVEAWRKDYNDFRPHSSLGIMTQALSPSRRSIKQLNKARKLTSRLELCGTGFRE